MSTRRSQLTREAARLFAEKGYHGTSIGDLAKAMGVQKGSLYAHITSKEDLLYETMRDGADAFHAVLDAIPDELPATEKIRLALRGHLRVVAEQLDVATVFVREWRYLEGERRDEIQAERRRYEERVRALFREGRELGELRTDLDDATAALLTLSAANWAYTWLQPGRDTDELADRFYALLRGRHARVRHAASLDSPPFGTAGRSWSRSPLSRSSCSSSRWPFPIAGIPSRKSLLGLGAARFTTPMSIPSSSTPERK